MGWDDEGNLVIAEFGPSTERFILVDVSTGEEIGTIDTEMDHAYYEDDAVWIDHSDGNLILERDDSAGAASFPAPESYDIHMARTMGDDRIVFADELGRVAITYLGEDVTPVLVADNALEWWGVAARS